MFARRGSVPPRLTIGLVLVAGASAAAALAQPAIVGGFPLEPNQCENNAISGVGDQESCELEPLNKTGCLYSFLIAQFDLWTYGVDETRGRPLNLDPRVGLGPPDFPPRETDWRLSSSPLVSKEVAHTLGPAPLLKRPTLNGELDLMTGMPLVQETDFTLPFGGAEFRHVRTYSDQSATHFIDYVPTWCRQASYLDWCGRRWMMSQSPAFLFEANYWWNYGQPPRCYFVVDSHHTIPFTFDSSNGTYTAPPWFGAVLAHDGVWDVDEWTTWPRTFWIWLHRGALKYTIEMATTHDPVLNFEYYDDVSASMHEPPGESPSTPAPAAAFGYSIASDDALPSDWQGIPFYGRVTRIEDRFGNRIINHYGCSKRQVADPNHPSEVEGCQHCAQNCDTKDQITGTTLVTSDGTVAWTILYAYRSFFEEEPDENYAVGAGTHPIEYLDPNGFPPDPSPPEVCPQFPNREHTQTMVHAVYVYPGEFSDPNEVKQCRTLDGTQFCCAETREALEAIEPVVPEGWRIRVRYTYDQVSHLQDLPYLRSRCRWGFYVPSISKGGPNIYTNEGMLLMKATVTQRSDAEETTRNTLYRWQTMSEAWENGDIGLLGIVDDGAIRSILRAEELAGEQNHPTTVVDLMGVSNDAYVHVLDPQTGGLLEDEQGNPVTRPLIEFSRLQFSKRQVESEDAPAQQGRKALSPDEPHTRSVRSGRCEFFDRRDEEELRYIVHYYRVVPDCNALDQADTPDALWMPQQRYPYRTACGDPQADWSWAFSDLDMSQPFYMTVIERMQTGVEYEWGFSSDVDFFYPGLLSRRVVEISPAGYVLRDRTWNYETDPAGQTTESQGFLEEIDYDDCGRIKERRSAGWGSPDNADPSAEGLIYVYEYDDSGGCDCESEPCDEPGELLAVGVKQGTGGQAQYLERYAFGVEGRPDLITERARYATPTADLEDPPDEYTIYDYVLEDDLDDTHDFEARVMEKTVARSIGVHDSTEMFAIERAQYNSDGNEKYRGWGSVADPADPGQEGDTYFITRSEYDPDKSHQKIRVTFDTDDEGDFTTGFVREAGVDPLDETTLFFYDDIFGLTKIIHPNGRETHVTFKQDTYDDRIFYQRTYKDMVHENNELVALSPVEINRFEDGVLAWSRKGNLTEAAPSEGPTGWEEYEQISESKPKYDANGRLAGVEQTGADGSSMSALVIPGPGGQPIKQVAPDGTITRHVYDQLGRLSKTFRGTDDTHLYWGTAPPPDDPGEPNAFEYSDNLALVEKRYYAEGVNDAYKLSQVRTFRDSAVNQYDLYDLEEPNRFEANNEDSLGWVTNYQYDWRMREVWVERRDPNDAPISHTLTWYDNLNRVRFVAGFGPTAPTGDADPRARAPDDGDPTAGGILDLSGEPQSLMETLYNSGGQVSETRQYDVESDPCAPTYLSTFTLYDHGDRPVEVQSPGGGVQKNAYDAKGRQVRSESWADDSIVTRTLTVYDDNNRATQSIHWERRHDASSSTYVESEGVLTYNFTWYDEAGRTRASANFGANDPNNHYVSGALPEYDEPNDAEALGALVTRYFYDGAGRQNRIEHPDGTVTEHVYDSLGRILLSSENADGAVVRRTAYKYDAQTGQLTRMAAVLPDHATPEDPDWEAADGTLQVTQFLYDAAALDRWGAERSRNKSWISEVHYPNSQTGAPDPNRALAFEYYFDGSLATRTDANGNIFRYHYDNLGRRTLTTIDDSAVYTNPQTQEEYEYAPYKRVQAIEYTYAPDGRLVTTRATWNGGLRISDHFYEYDGLRNLTAEWQEHGQQIGPSSAVVKYEWEVAGAGSGNISRLTRIIYPGHDVTPYNFGVTLEYDATSLDDALGRVTRLSFRSPLANTYAVGVDYEYAGLGRRVSATLDNGVTQSLGGTGVSPVNGYGGLDRFGRVADLHYKLAGDTVHRYQYGYDAAGNREYARVTQATVSSTPHDNDRSYDYQYDALQRLIAADRGALNSGNTAIETTPTPTQSDWALDILGNWTGDTNVAGYTEQFDTAITETTHAVNLGNELTQVTVDSGSPVTVGYVCDRNGNLIYDGSFWLQYDAFNRLCQVHPAGGLDPNSFNPSGSLKDPNAAPDWIARYVHDAFGRLMRKRAPHPGDPDKRVTDEYYYDGVRRIQTKTTWQAVSGWPSGAAWQEYVYGPDYVDEFVAFVDDPLGAGVGTYYTLQDANYNLMATLRANANDGGPGGGGGGLTAENVVVRQYQWSPYGAPVVAETLTDNLPSAVTEAQAAAAGRSGHQGLFFERYDAGPDEPGIAANAAGIYYNRARFYTPYLGRFLQRDMNGAGLPVPVAAVARGLAMLLDRGQFDPFQHYHDGHNLFLYLGGAATNQRDPLGLVYDPFEDVDDYLTGDYIGGRVSAAEAQLTFFNQSFNAAQMTAGLLFSLVPGSDAIKLGIALAQGDQVSWTDVGAAVASVGGAALLVKAYQGYKKYQRAQNATKIVGAAAKRLLKPGDVVCGFAKDGKVVGDAAHGLMDHESLAIAMGIRNADGALEAGYEAFTVVKDARGIVSVLPSGKFGNLGGSVPQHVKDIVLGTFD